MRRYQLPGSASCQRHELAFWTSVRFMSEAGPVTPGWRAVGMCWDGDAFDLEGLNPWEHEWEHSKPDRIVVAHPENPAQRHEVDVWVIRAPDRVVRFAAGEMSNLAWAFFSPVYE
jgi:hypothetical protein